MKTVVITYKGVVIKDPHQQIGKRANTGDVVTVSDDDATLLIGMGRAKPYDPPEDPPKEPPIGEPEREQKKEGASAPPPRPERKKE